MVDLAAAAGVATAPLEVPALPDKDTVAVQAAEAATMREVAVAEAVAALVLLAPPD